MKSAAIRCLFAGMSSLAAATAVLAQSAAEIEKRAAESIARLKLQTELPTGDRPNTGWELNLPEINISNTVVWMLLVIGVAVVLYSVRDELPWLRIGKKSKWAGGGELDPAAEAGQLHGAPAADELAGQGRYVEAMHILLLNALAEIRRRVGEQFADSLTSREILRRANIPTEGRASLRDLITRVELSYFGAYPAEQQDYLACRHSFDVLLRSLPAEARA